MNIFCSHTHTLIKPQRMWEGLSTAVICVCVCVYCLATFLVYMSKVRRHTVSCRLLAKDLYCVEFTENVLFGGYGGS